mgnify:CR=1 FL=1
MGATLKHKEGTGGKSLKRVLDKYRNSVQGKSVVAGLVKGKSSAENIEKGYKNEFGGLSSGMREIPARPFMAQSVPFVKEAIQTMPEKFDVSNPKEYLNAVGKNMADAIVMSIDSQDFTPNAEFTRLHKSFAYGHEKILVETGSMRSDMKHEIRKA